MRLPSAVLLLTALTVALPLAAQGSDAKGKYYFKKNCKTCHAQGKSKLSPLSMTQAQWKKYFQTGKHGGEPLSPKLGTPQQIMNIKTFLINHASDSPQPETCGG